MPVPQMHASDTPTRDSQRPLGLLAGWGQLPLEVADALVRQDLPVATIAIRDHASPELIERSQHFEWIGLGSLGRAIRLFKRWRVKQAIMAGKIHKVALYQPGWWLKHRPDWKCLRAFSPQLLWGASDRKDDTLLTTIVDTFAADDIVFQPATQLVPSLLAQEGQLAGRPLSARQVKDALFGWQIAKSMGDLDIGQSVCIKDQTVIAVEAIEGTDLCIRRAGDLCTAGGMTVVKVAKPRQDMRFDVPTVGPLTLESLAAAGGGTLVLEANRTIVLQRQTFLQSARKLGISVVAMHAPGAQAAAA